MNSVVNDQEDNCLLCEAHRTFLIRYMAEELRRQEAASKRFLRERRKSRIFLRSLKLRGKTPIGR
jgi:hypothetical protein